MSQKYIIPFLIAGILFCNCFIALASDVLLDNKEAEIVILKGKLTKLDSKYRLTVARSIHHHLIAEDIEKWVDLEVKITGLVRGKDPHWKLNLIIEVLSIEKNNDVP